MASWADAIDGAGIKGTRAKKLAAWLAENFDSDTASLANAKNVDKNDLKDDLGFMNTHLKKWDKLLANLSGNNSSPPASNSKFNVKGNGHVIDFTGFSGGFNGQIGNNSTNSNNDSSVRDDHSVHHTITTTTTDHSGDIVHGSMTKTTIGGDQTITSGDTTQGNKTTTSAGGDMSTTNERNSNWGSGGNRTSNSGREAGAVRIDKSRRTNNSRNTSQEQNVNSKNRDEMNTVVNSGEQNLSGRGDTATQADIARLERKIDKLLKLVSGMAQT